MEELFVINAIKLLILMGKIVWGNEVESDIELKSPI